jgi:L-seryl-tRNA(Ser) seleniumtransferase
MTQSHARDFLRSIPAVDEVLSHPSLATWRRDHPNFPWTRLVRAILDDLRAGGADEIGERPDRAAVTEWVVQTLAVRVETLRRGGLRPVLNGTGVVLHTNLGRAPLHDRAAAAAARALRGYVSLEVDLATGERAKRGDVLEAMFCVLTGAEAAMVVNNNAAAVYLVANSCSPPGRVVVSRGELVEIGGSFRLPEILRHAAAGVIEVGTTNRTYAADYEKAAQPGDLILKVHKSNYEIEGFVHEATIGELVTVARARACQVVYDLGSGAVYDFAGAGVGRDPTVERVIAEGVDAVTMSGDKLLGGVQAGIILGTREFVGRLKQNPLRRAVRVDKVAIAALQEVVRSYLFASEPREEVPVLACTLADPDDLRARAARVVSEVGPRTARSLRVADDEAVVGGGSLSTVSVPSAAVVVRGESDADAVRLARALRLGAVPVFTRVKGSEVRVNMTTILPDEEGDLVRALVDVLAAPG